MGLDFKQMNDGVRFALVITLLMLGGWACGRCFAGIELGIVGGRAAGSGEE